MTSPGQAPYTSFEACTVNIEGQMKRGVRVRCMTCGKKAEVVANSRRGSGGGGYDDDIIERNLTEKFERLGWKIGKNLHNNLCPEHKPKENVLMINKNDKPASDKVVMMNTTAVAPPRGPTRDEKRIIFQKIDEMYVGETVGYHKDWSDERVAKDLNVPVAWVATIREENFGPNIDEASNQVIQDARALLNDVKMTIQAWNIRADQIEKAIQTLSQRK